MRRPALAVLALLAFTLGVLTACSNEPATEPVAQDVAVAAPSTAPAPSTPALPPPAEIGQVVTNGGITLTVESATFADSIELNESGYQAGSGYEEYTTTEPDSGGRYVVIDTHVVNNARVSLDLTCSLPISTVLVDTQDRQFDPIDELYQLRDNPECNDQLQPGFEADMTWVYLVPEGASILGWAFVDVTENLGSSDYSVVRTPL